MKQHDYRANEKAKKLAERMPIVIRRIIDHKPGETVSKRVIATSNGWTTGINEAFDIAMQNGLIERYGNTGKFRRIAA